MISISFNLFNMLERQPLELRQKTVTGGGRWTDEPPTNLGDGTMANCRCTGPDSGYEVMLVYQVRPLYLLTVNCRVTSPGIKTAASGAPGYKASVAAGGISSEYQVGVTYWPSHAAILEGDRAPGAVASCA